MGLTGEWVKGPFLCTTIEGFIIDTSNGFCKIIIKKIEDVGEYIPPRLQIGSVHYLPIRVIEEFYTHFNFDQQLSLIETVQTIGDHNWVTELKEQFYNPFISKQII